MCSEQDETIEGPFDGPRTLVHVGDETHWRVTSARAEAEIAARARFGDHPLVATRIERRGDVLVFPRLAPLGDPADALDVVLPREIVLDEQVSTTRDVLARLGGPVDAVRALGRTGLSRSRVDRFLARSMLVRTPRGIDLGGVMPAGIRSSARGAVAISVRYGREDGWPVLDLASLALRAELDAAVLHRDLGGNDEAFDLALLHEALRELTADRDEVHRVALRALVHSLVERFVPAEPPRVVLSVQAPSFFAPSLFAPIGDVESAHARRVLRDWDGLAVGGSILAVRTTPALAKPPRLFPFEPTRARRARLFSRFHEGIVFDDEGLFSATPEALADRIASGLSGVVVDATCGIGSIAIALARSSRVSRVVAIDRDPTRVGMAAHNASLYGVRDRIEFRVGDALELVPQLAFDALVIDPPWGGRNYDRARITLDELGMVLAPLLALDRPIVLKLPRSFDVTTLPPGFEIEPLIDARGVLKMLVARRGVASSSRP